MIYSMKIQKYLSINLLFFLLLLGKRKFILGNISYDIILAMKRKISSMR